MESRQLSVFSDIDLYTDDELLVERSKMDVRHKRLRDLVLKGRVPRETLDTLTAQRDALGNEIVRRRL